MLFRSRTPHALDWWNRPPPKHLLRSKLYRLVGFCLNPPPASNAIRWADTMQIEVDQNHSVFMRCWDCLMWGIPAPENVDTCENCGGHSVTVYYPSICPTPLAVDGATPFCQCVNPVFELVEKCAVCEKPPRH